MADLARVNSGDAFTPKSGDWNAFVDAARYVQKVQGGRTGGRTKQAKERNGCYLRVQNVSGGKLDRFSAVRVKDVVCAPDPSDDTKDQTLEFINNFTFTVEKPTDDDKGKWVLLLDPLEDQDVGLACVQGVTVCKINLADAADTLVDCSDGEPMPQSGTDGGYQLLWVKGGVTTADQTGEQWVVMRIGGGAGGSLPEGQYQGMILQMATDNQIGYDFLCSHAMESI